MPRKDFDIIIVGSGTCGATLAKELSGCGKSVLVAERGQFFTSKQTGSEFKALKYYDRCGLWSKTKEGVVYYRAIMAGGTSIISCGNGVRSMEKYFKKMGIDLKKEFAETEKELCIKPVPKKFLGPGTRAIMKASSALGFKMFPMPKYINFKKCIACGNCVLGCLSEAKWSALRYLKDAQKRGASVQFELNVSRVLVKNKRAVGIEAVAKNGAKQNIYADTVILAAGGLGTPVILQNSGIKAGQKLFLDLFTVTTGLAKSKGMTGEVVMGAVHLNKGFLLSPFIDV
ncbi:MAG: FAD-dependent oxidoreductase, partial [Candidatus Omnitrophica bacterium]|nr:FAD-dependent oxidoreductase [Candidatus Omnitrophota bacterium]